MSAKDLIFVKQLEAINSRLNESVLFFEGKVRRWYSQNFCTPLDQTFKLSWDFILKNYYESMIEDKTFDEVYDLAVANYLPELMEDEEKSAQEFADSLIEEQECSLRKIEKKSEKIEKKVPEFKPIRMTFDEEEM